MKSTSKDGIEQVTTENVHVNAVTSQKLQNRIAVAVDQPAAAQNSQNYNITTIHNIMCECTIVEVIQNPNCSYWPSDVGIFGTAGLALLNYTSSATENSSIVQHQPLCNRYGTC